jgi:hypothetical protein
MRHSPNLLPYIISLLREKVEGIQKTSKHIHERRKDRKNKQQYVIYSIAHNIFQNKDTFMLSCK